MTLEQQVCNLLSDVQLNLSDKPWLVPIEMEIKCFKDMEPDGTISCPNVEIQTVKFIQDYLHFDLKSPACELCPHSYVILAWLMNDSSVSDVLPYISNARENKLAQQRHLVMLIAENPDNIDRLLNSVTAKNENGIVKSLSKKLNSGNKSRFDWEKHGFWHF